MASCWFGSAKSKLPNFSTTRRQFRITSSRSLLEDQTVTDGQGFKAAFEVDPFRKFCLIEGLDDIGLTLRHEAALDTFEAMHDNAAWLKAK